MYTISYSCSLVQILQFLLVKSQMHFKLMYSPFQVDVRLMLQFIYQRIKALIRGLKKTRNGRRDRDDTGTSGGSHHCATENSGMDTHILLVAPDEHYPKKLQSLLKKLDMAETWMQYLQFAANCVFCWVNYGHLGKCTPPVLRILVNICSTVLVCFIVQATKGQQTSHTIYMVVGSVLAIFGSWCLYKNKNAAEIPNEGRQDVCFRVRMVFTKFARLPSSASAFWRKLVIHGDHHLVVQLRSLTNRFLLFSSGGSSESKFSSSKRDGGAEFCVQDGPSSSVCRSPYFSFGICAQSFSSAGDPTSRFRTVLPICGDRGMVGDYETRSR